MIDYHEWQVRNRKNRISPTAETVSWLECKMITIKSAWIVLTGGCEIFTNCEINVGSGERFKKSLLINCIVKGDNDK